MERKLPSSLARARPRGWGRWFDDGQRHTCERHALERRGKHIHLNGVAAGGELFQRNLDEVRRLLVRGFFLFPEERAGFREFPSIAEEHQRRRGRRGGRGRCGLPTRGRSSLASV